MRDAKISKRRLAREIAKESGKDPEATRISVHRWLRGANNPSAANQRHLEKVLGKPRGYFSVRQAPKAPKEQRALETQLAAARGEAAQLESRVLELERELQRAREDSA